MTQQRIAALQFVHGDGDGLSRVTAHDGDRQVGELHYYPDDGMIQWVEVHPDYQEQGVGREMLNQARQRNPAVHHSPNKTNAGAAWAEKVGVAQTARVGALQFVRHDVHPDADDDAHAVSAYLGRRPVGRIRWHPDGELHQIEVDPAHRHKHIATDMFNWAQANVEPRLHHSPAMTDEGRQWAASMGYRPQEYTRVPEATGALWRTAMPMPLPDDITFRYHPTNESIPERLDGVMPVLAPAVSAWRGRIPVGTLEWHPGGEISYVHVPKEHQGQSIATGMMDEALKHAPEVHHSENLTTQGRGWSQYEQNRTKKQDDTEAAWAQYEKARRAFRITAAFRLAAVNQDLVDRLHNEFNNWAIDNDAKGDPRDDDWGRSVRGPIGSWPNIENFLKDNYPAAHRGHSMGREQAQPLLDVSLNNPESYNPQDDPRGWKRDEKGRVVPKTESDNLLKMYETGPDAVAKHGYDPSEIAAGMMLLHNKSHPFRGDLAQEDQARLNDIFNKRQQMQDAYKQRLVQAFRITAAFALDAGALGPTPPLTFEPYKSAWFNGIMARHADDGRPVGFATWYPEDGEIDAIHSHPEFRGRGIVKAMGAHAMANPDIYEAKGPIHQSNYMSAEGLAFAKSHPDYDPSQPVTLFNGKDDAEWGWKPPEWVSTKHPYRGQSEAELAPRLTPGFHSRNAFRLTAAFKVPV